MEPVEIREAVLILALCEERSFSRVAERYFISQSSLSKIIKKTEKNLGIKIFDRTSFPIKVTEEGQQFIVLFQRLYEIHKEIERRSDRINREKRVNLTVAAPRFFYTYLLPEVVQRFKKENPGINVQLIETNHIDMLGFLKAGIVDIGISANAKISPELQCHVLKQEHIILAVPKNLGVNRKIKQHAIAYEDLCSGAYLQKAESVPMSTFAGEHFVFLNSRNDTRTRALQVCYDAGFEPKIVMEIDQLLTAYYMAEAGKGLTFIRAGIPCYVGKSENLYFYKIDHPAMSRDICGYVTRENQQEQVHNKFIEYLKQYPMSL